MTTKHMNIYEALESDTFVELVGRVENFVTNHMGCDTESPEPAVEREYVAREIYFMAERLGCLNELEKTVRRK